MGKYVSISETIQEDTSVAVTAEAEQVLGAGAKAITAEGGGVVLSDSQVGDIVIEQYPKAVQESVKALVGSVETAVTKSSEAQIASSKQAAAAAQQSTEALAQKLKETEVGAVTVLPEIAKYLALAVVGIIVGLKVLKHA